MFGVGFIIWKIIRDDLRFGDDGVCCFSVSGTTQINLANTSIEVSRQNLYRFARILFPPEPEVLSKMCQQVGSWNAATNIECFLITFIRCDSYDPWLKGIAARKFWCNMSCRWLSWAIPQNFIGLGLIGNELRIFEILSCTSFVEWTWCLLVQN